MAEHNVEKNLGRLEEIVVQMESEDVDLESALKLFEEGVQLAEDVQKVLKDSELKIKQVLEGAQGFSTEDFQL